MNMDDLRREKFAPTYCHRCSWGLQEWQKDPPYVWPYRCPRCGYVAGRTCDCGVRFVTFSDVRRRYCGAVCAARGATARARERRATRRERICRRCHEPFTGRRRDASYCSSACRQAAYRHRVTDRSGSVPEPQATVTKVAI